MAGTWMSIVEGFGGMRIKNGKLSFVPRIPEQWKAYSFKINFRNQIIKVNVNQNETHFELEGSEELDILINNSKITIAPNTLVTI